VGFFAPGGSGQSVTYRFTWTLDIDTPDAMQGQSAAFELAWEASNAAHAPPAVFGRNDFGQLGLGDTTDRPSPTTLGSVATWTQLDAGTFHSCGTRLDVGLWCWGRNDTGSVGDGTTTGRTAPVRVGLATTWTSVSTFRHSTCATQSDPSVWCWGVNTHGRLGQGDTTDRSAPAQVGATGTWVLAAAGYDHMCAVSLEGTLWRWGDLNSSTTPAQVGTATTWAGISGGGAHDCGLQRDRTLWCWGANTYGEVGDGTTTTRPTPQQVLTGVRSHDSSGDHTLAPRWPGPGWGTGRTASVQRWSNSGTGTTGVGDPLLRCPVAGTITPGSRTTAWT
jgi:alpha-tubulin suppressor-like RCC1 family protein